MNSHILSYVIFFIDNIFESCIQKKVIIFVKNFYVYQGESILFDF